MFGAWINLGCSHTLGHELSVYIIIPIAYRYKYPGFDVSSIIDRFFSYSSALQTVEVEMPFCAENVCVEFDEESGHMYGVGSRSHVTFLDDRVPASTVGSLKSLDPDCGWWSLSF